MAFDTKISKIAAAVTRSTIITVCFIVCFVQKVVWEKPEGSAKFKG